MARRNRKPLLGRNGRKARHAGQASRSWPVLGRRKALWRFVGALALAPLGGTAFAQAPPEVMVPPGAMGAPPIFAQNAYSPVAGPGYAGPRGPAPMIAPPPVAPGGAPVVGIPIGNTFTPRLVTDSGIGDGLGWQDGYTSMGAWVPLGINSENMVLYLDARGYVAYNQGGGGNFTMGYRYYVPGYDRYFGVYGAYDIDGGTSTGETFHQAAVGLESVGRYLSYRVNGYIPLGDTNKGVYDGVVGDPFFRGNNIFFLDRVQTRHQYGGIDGEVGGPLPMIGKYGLSGYVGGYWLTSDVDDTIGFKGRLEANVNDDLQLGVKLTQDEIFDSNLWFTLTVRSPRGSWWDFFQKDWLRQPGVQTQMDRAPMREYRIATDLKTNDTEQIAINPRDGQPYVVLHVDPNGAGGTGIFENPAARIRGANAPGYDLIYVQPGTLASAGAIRLFDNQRLLSTAVPHQFGTQRGLLTLPGFTGGPLPELRNLDGSASSVIVLANNNEVSGFAINGAGQTGSGVFHTGIAGNGITNFDINRNEFFNTNGGVVIRHTGNGQGFLVGNAFSGLGSAVGGGPGFDITTVGNSELAMTINRNIVSGAAGAGIALQSQDNSTITADIRDNTITNTVADNDPLTEYNGEGLYVNLTDNGQFVDSVIDGNLFQGNFLKGLRFRAEGSSAIRNVLVGNVDGDNDNGNIFTANSDGLGIIRVGNAAIDNLRIIDNEFVNNGDDGLEFVLGGGLLDILDVTVAENNISNNGGDGFVGEVQSDAIIDLTLRNNVFVGNGDDGIEFGQNRFAIDNAHVAGTWTGNLFSQNGGNGIDISAPMIDLFVGTADVGNTITRNSLAGILLEGPGFDTTFTNNTIANNGQGLTDITFGAGIDIEGVGFKGFRFVNNRIVDNFGDGVEIEAGTGGVSQFFELDFTNNIVARNDGRGYDVLNKSNSFLDLTIRGTAPGLSVIAENGREGIYVVNTASDSQTQQGATPVVGNPSDDATHGMANDGGHLDGSNMLLTVTQNQIIGNGIDQTSTVGQDSDAVGGSGLVIRVGTGGGGYGFTQDGGLATDRFAGVTATVTDNFLSGNFGADVYIESFTSTVNPPDTAGTWDADEFTVDNYDGDPLARLDLTFTGNTFESIDVNNEGAFYNNDEGDFKSRTFKDDANPDGPFATDMAGRRRNAQRLAYRDETLPSSQFPGGLTENDGGFYDLGPQPSGSFSDRFLYAGMGQSTFRISQETFLGENTIINADGTTTVLNAGSFFSLDNNPYNDVGDANGAFLINARFGEQPYGWSIAP